jgi:hypothetical protein
VQRAFTQGLVSSVMEQLQNWGVADGRWKLAAQSAFERAIPVVREDGSIGRFALTLMPQWV